MFGIESARRGIATTALRLNSFLTVTQGSLASSATLGWRPQSLWDCSRASSRISETASRKSQTSVFAGISESPIRNFTDLEWLQLVHRPQNIPNRNVVALTEFLLHMQQKVVMDQAWWNVRSCRLTSRSTSTRRRSLRTATNACCPK